MYAIVGRTLVIIEHFAFDASRETKRGGMEQIRKDRRAKAEMEEEIKSGKTEAMIVERVGAELTFFDWKLNFEYHFDSHYRRCKFLSLRRFRERRGRIRRRGRCLLNAAG